MRRWIVRSAETPRMTGLASIKGRANRIAAVARLRSDANRRAQQSATPPPGSRAVEMTEAEEELWDELWDTDAARCCSCPSCNYYAPDYGQHKDEPCILRTLIERIIAGRMAQAWREGHMTYRRLGPDGCDCEAWNESECGCGRYGSNVITPNPYVSTSSAREARDA